MTKTHAEDAVLARVKEYEAKRKSIYWIPEDGSSFVEGEGYRVCIVFAGDNGYHLTGTWPYTGAVGETRPYFWGDDLAKAQEIADEINARRGVTHEEAVLIVARSMARGAPRKRGR